MVDSYYANLLGAALDRQHSIDPGILQLPSRDLAHLDLAFTEEEVENIIKSMPCDKAQGKYGFIGRFFATCWEVTNDDIMRAFNSFYHGDM